MTRALLFLACLACLAALSAACDDHVAEAAGATGGDPRRGLEKIESYGCGSCHTIPGVPGARATVGPPLDRVARRTYLAGRVLNDPGTMARWIEHPHDVDDATAMPELAVTHDDAVDITAYLYTLR